MCPMGARKPTLKYLGIFISASCPVQTAQDMEGNVIDEDPREELRAKIGMVNREISSISETLPPALTARMALWFLSLLKEEGSQEPCPDVEPGADVQVVALRALLLSAYLRLVVLLQELGILLSADERKMRTRNTVLDSNTWSEAVSDVAKG